MTLYTEEQKAKLLQNGLLENTDKDHTPVVKWFTPDANATWLVNELLNDETAFGLCYMGHGFPELGYINIQEITEYVSPNGHKIERDIHFEGKFPMSVYAQAARSIRMITDNFNLLLEAEQNLKEKKLSL